MSQMIHALCQNKPTSEMMKFGLNKRGKTKKSETQSVNVIYFALTISRLQ